nr:hypothetical protein CFP56_51115 [Quercus suber]
MRTVFIQTQTNYPTTENKLSYRSVAKCDVRIVTECETGIVALVLPIPSVARCITLASPSRSITESTTTVSQIDDLCCGIDEE